MILIEGSSHYPSGLDNKNNIDENHKERSIDNEGNVLKVINKMNYIYLIIININYIPLDPQAQDIQISC